MKQLTFVIALMLMISSCKQNKEQVTIESEVIEQVESSSEWSILFDGTNFDNWRGYLTDEMYPEWSIEDGAMAFNPGEEGGKNIITKKTYTNFILSLEWKISEGGNSGIFWSIYEDSKFNEAYQTGPEIQVLDNERHPDALANPKFHQAGALYDMVQPMHDVCKPAGDWNKCVLKVDHTKNEGSVTLNGTVIVEFPLHGEEWDALVSDSKFKDWEAFGKHQTGHIGLQDHSDKVWFRDIKIKEL
ncbi:DUF1080 domain-containing protein [Algibacter sp.]|nr:DUF1080 domain-containing protein [Algibacter sp.]MDC1365102.1 DUF1080 domain-containing protein [Algibacter sp.]